jgi:hypothetical protein
VTDQEEMCRAQVWPDSSHQRPCRRRGPLTLLAHGKALRVCRLHLDVSLRGGGLWLYLHGFERPAEWVGKGAIT